MIAPARLAAMAVACVVVVVGCGDSYSPKPSQANLAESDAILKRLAKLPGVVRVDGGYVRNATDPGSAGVGIGVREGADMEALADKAIGAFWRSRLDPITAMDVTVVRTDKPTLHVFRNVNFKLDADELTQRYGARPRARR
jgi:cobalamin biosynthesis protein CbiG